MLICKSADFIILRRMSKNISIKGIRPVMLTGLVAIGGVSLSVAAASPAQAASTISSVAPDPVAVGGRLTIKGTCATPGDDAVNIFIQVYDNAGTARAELMAPVAADDSFDAAIVIPSGFGTGMWSTDVECGYADHDVSTSPRVEFKVVEAATATTVTPTTATATTATPTRPTTPPRASTLPSTL